MSPIDGPLDCKYTSPCKNCPLLEKDKLAKHNKGVKMCRFGLQPECENCNKRLELVDRMEKDPVTTQLDYSGIPESVFQGHINRENNDN